MPPAKKKSAKKKEVTVDELWAQSKNEIKNEPKKYSMSAAFEVGNAIDHPSFGLGFVQMVFDKTKMKVLFEDSIKILVHSQEK